MTNSFIHFQNSNLESVDLYSYEGETLHSNHQSVALSEVKNILIDSSNIFMLIPSQLFGFLQYDNAKDFKGEVLKANVFMQIEDQLISDVSSLEFFYNSDLKLASWIDSSLFQSLSSSFDEIDAEIIILPEHFLFQDQQNVIYFKDKSFIASFSDGSGFGGSISILSEYIRTLDSSNFLNSPLVALKENSEITIQNFTEPLRERSLGDIHIASLKNLKLLSWNLFRRKLSLQFLRSKFKLNSMESVIISASVLIILLIPIITNALLHQSISTFQASTMQIFQQLSPGLTRLVNPKAQIDDLTRGAPLQSIVTRQNFQALTFIDQLADESIQMIEIDFEKSIVSTSVENLPAYKLAIFKELIKTESVNVNSEELIQGPDGLYGKLQIYYNEE